MSASGLDDRFQPGRQIADAVLYEGYVLYPYRASAGKNQLRWQFGVLGPEGSTEASSMRTEVVVELRRDARLHVRVRGLQVQARTVELPGPDGRFVPVASLDTGDRVWTSFDEAVEHELDVADLELEALIAEWRVVELVWPPARLEEPILGRTGELAGRVVRARWPVAGRVTISAVRCDGPYPLAKVTVCIDNTGVWDPSLTTPGSHDRDQVVRRSLVAVHTLLALDGGRLLSVLDPPEFARPAVAGCRSSGTFPVLVDDDLVLSSPIILYDRPAVAPESQGDMFDGTEIDEILALRVLTLTDDEKREARGTDPRSAALVDRCESMSADAYASLHGTFRSVRSLGLDPQPGAPEAWWRPEIDGAFDPWTDTVAVGGAEIGKGSRVRLHPSRRADAQDLFVDGRQATVAGVFHDVDDEVHLAVVLDDDPAAELHQWHGRYLYFHLDEVEVMA